MDLKIGDLLSVRWLDSATMQGWFHPAAPEAMECQTVGVLIDESEELLVLAMSWATNQDGEFGNGWVILKRTVTAVEVLRAAFAKVPDEGKTVDGRRGTEGPRDAAARSDDCGDRSCVGKDNGLGAVPTRASDR